MYVIAYGTKRQQSCEIEKNSVLASFSASSSQSRITCENSFNTDLSRSGWPIGMFVGDGFGC